MALAKQSSATPLKASPRAACAADGGHTIKIPAVRKAGNPLKEQELEAQYDLLAQMVEEMIADPSHITPLHGQLQKRLSTKRLQIVAAADAQFDRLPSLRALPEERAIGFLSSRSKGRLTGSMLVQAKSHDEEAIGQLMHFITQLPSSVKLPADMLVKDVTRRVLTKLVEKVGEDRLPHFVQAGGIANTGAINWKKGAYDLQFHQETRRLVKVTFVSNGDVADQLPADTHIDSTWIMDQNWSDQGAFIKKSPYPPVKLRALFSKLTGPNKLSVITNRSREWIDLVAEQRATWDADMRRTDGNQASDEAVKQGLQELSTAKRTTQMAQLQEKASLRINTKRAKREINFAGEAVAPARSAE